MSAPKKRKEKAPRFLVKVSANAENASISYSKTFVAVSFAKSFSFHSHLGNLQGRVGWPHELQIPLSAQNRNIWYYTACERQKF